MKRTTVVTLVLFVALLSVWWLRTNATPTPALTPLTIPGYLGDVTAEDARAKAVAERAPWTAITLERSHEGKTERIDLQQDVSPVAASGSTPAVEAKWSGKHTVGDHTDASPIQAFRAAAITELWQRTIHANFAVHVTPAQLADYGLDDAHAIDARLTGGNAPLHVRVGQLQKSEKYGEAATWVQDPAHRDVAYEVVGRDLRTAVAVPWADLIVRAPAPAPDSPAAPDSAAPPRAPEKGAAAP